MTAITTNPLHGSAPLGASWSAPTGALGAVVCLGGSFTGAAMAGARDHRAPRRYAKRFELQGFENDIDRQPEDRRGRENVGAEIGRGGGTP